MNDKKRKEVKEIIGITTEGINTAVDNDKCWDRQQLRGHLFNLQKLLLKIRDKI